MTRRRVPRDPTGRTATTNALTLDAGGWGQIETIIHLLAVLDLPDAEISRQTGMPRSHLVWTMGIDRPLSQGSWARPVLAELADGLPPDVRHAVEAAAQKEEQGVRRPCAWCGLATFPPPGRTGGRPRRFCSNACRQANHRERTRDRQASSPPDSTP